MRLNFNELIEFENCNTFFTAKQVYEKIKTRLSKDVSLNLVGRYLTSHSKEKYVSKQGVKYLCRVKE